MVSKLVVLLQPVSIKETNVLRKENIFQKSLEVSKLVVLLQPVSTQRLKNFFEKKIEKSLEITKSVVLLQPVSIKKNGTRS